VRAVLHAPENVHKTHHCLRLKLRCFGNALLRHAGDQGRRPLHRLAHLFGALRISLWVENYCVGFGSTHAGLRGQRPAQVPRPRGKDSMASILWIILVGFVAGIVARLLSAGPNNPTGFVLTTVLGVAGAFLATWLGQLVGWYRPDQGAGFIAAIVGSLIILFIWNRLVAHRIINDPGVDQQRLR
jgi:uncharacterized membrane protein YeaQ/YmgE (transglycosylase-associated protein family)